MRLWYNGSMSTRICKTCGEAKPPDGFPFRSSGRVELHCKECKNLRLRVYRKDNPTSRQSTKAWRTRYKEEHGESYSNYCRRTDPTKNLRIKCKTRLRKYVGKSNGGLYVEWMRKLHGEEGIEASAHLVQACMAMNQRFNEPPNSPTEYTVDHIRPVDSFFKEFGVNEEAMARADAPSNLRIITRRANIHKGAESSTHQA